MNVMRGQTSIQRRRIVVRGIVQGVGFRPFVYGVARRQGLVGTVLNDSTGVAIEIEGQQERIEAFLQALRVESPPLARIDAIHVESMEPQGETAFVIEPSKMQTERCVPVSPDTATCTDCLQELNNPSDRRYRYPFINCTNCGPRFTIVQDVPYDRKNTTMQVFSLCPRCQTEYDDPLNRRFHAQPTACPDCGPQLFLLDRASQRIAPQSTITIAAQQLAAGAILAVKGLGGYHLACDALHAQAVRHLRQRKYREAKPFALMVPDLKTAQSLCAINPDEACLLASRQRPIVLLRKQVNCPVASEVAPRYDRLGIMLPYTPLHHLLLQAFSAIVGPDHPAALVMTSGNLSEEPIIYRDDEAQKRLDSIAESMLLHNRAIHTRCDDSVVHITAAGMQILRRSRGYVPEPLSMAFAFPVPLLACGGHLKNTFCLGKAQQAYVSHHIGDLENLETLTAFHEGIAHFQRLFAIQPEAVAYDLHPEYLTTKFALETPIPYKMGIQHHHAHIASVLAEHGLCGPVIGVAADGTGYGLDGTVWGCEVMVADLLTFKRMAHLAYVPLPGGAQAIRQPWRMAAVYLAQTYDESFLTLDIPFVRQLEKAHWRPLSQMIARGLNSPQTSSLGRLFDAVAALLGLRTQVQYEGQAALELEMVAEAGQEPYPFAITDGEPVIFDVTPLIRAIVTDLQSGTTVPQIAGRFHSTVAELLANACCHIRKVTDLHTVALSGGVFQNRLLLESLVTRLQRLGFRIYTNHRVPPNDGGLSLGQAAIAAAQLRGTED